MVDAVLAPLLLGAFERVGEQVRRAELEPASPRQRTASALDSAAHLAA